MCHLFRPWFLKEHFFFRSIFHFRTQLHCIRDSLQCGSCNHHAMIQSWYSTTSESPKHVFKSWISRMKFTSHHNFLTQTSTSGPLTSASGSSPVGKSLGEQVGISVLQLFQQWPVPIWRTREGRKDPHDWPFSIKLSHLQNAWTARWFWGTGKRKSVNLLGLGNLEATTWGLPGPQIDTVSWEASVNLHDKWCKLCYSYWSWMFKSSWHCVWAFAKRPGSTRSTRSTAELQV